jgi:hypothetical protein
MLYQSNNTCRKPKPEQENYLLMFTLIKNEKFSSNKFSLVIIDNVFNIEKID